MDGNTDNSTKQAPTTVVEQWEEMEAKIQRMATNIIDMAVDHTLDFGG
jgi:hypothetical protein